ncbi:MAG TPA: hypothetical protein VN541_15300 [Tepidisphaeraceae bacterium]|nr:hypothetical protein [Tepidisphaeraceae bacterium]
MGWRLNPSSGNWLPLPACRSGGAKEAGGNATAVPLIFVATAVCLTLGGGWGATLLLRIAWGGDFGIVSGAGVHVHGLAQLWGWMALFVIAVASHLLRQNTKRPSPPWVEYAAAGLIIAGLLAFFAGLAEPLRAAIPEIDVLASLLLAAAAILFGISVIWPLTGRSSQNRHGLVFLVGWLWAWAGTDVWLRLHYVDAPVLPDSARGLLIALPVLGFATNAIYGFGVRLIPGLLNVRRLRSRWLTTALLMHNSGLCLFLLPLHGLSTTGAVLMLLASGAYLIGMDGLRSKQSRPIYGVDPRGHVLIRVAFFWLVCGLAMIVAGQFFPALPHAYRGAWRHALTVGFITTMIVGVGQRIVPVFIRQPLASTRMMLAGGALLVAGNAGRVALELATMGRWTWAFRLMGFTGLAELTGVTLFAVNLALTVRNRRHVYAAGEPLTPDTRVHEAINALPDLQHRIAELGITMFDKAAFIAPSMTLGALALACGRQPHELVRQMRAPDGVSADLLQSNPRTDPSPLGSFV